MPTAHRRFRFKAFWLRLDGFHDTVATAWSSVHDPDPFQRLVRRLQATARALTSWSARSTGNVRDKLVISRELIARFDHAMESRLLSPAEDWLRKQLKVAYLGLASLERTIARQRARISFLAEGDANTSFFHKQCTFRRQKNRVHSLLVDGHVLCDHEEMAQAAFAHFDGLLGTAVDREHTLDLEQLVTAGDLGSLDAPFTPEEIWAAVRRMPAHKAPGPDGFSAKFLRACWGIIRQDILDVFEQLFLLRGRGFGKLNQALLTLLPKRADAQKLGDYRPICLIHIMAKLFAKVLSLRIAPKLDSLVSRNQNAFIAGRSLHDNFMLVRQSLWMLHHLGAPCIMLKLDLTRAFDSISWPFLFEMLRQYGFGDRFREWIAILLSSSSTRIILNGVPGPPIWHCRGLHQGDSTSPQLFVLAVDALGHLMHRALQAGILQRLHPRRTVPAVSLYADDVMLFCHAEMDEVLAVKGILGIFEAASGLQVNYGKSSATTLHGDEDSAALLEALGCQAANLPITYLGIPLTTRRPTVAQMQPLVDAVAGRLPTWKSWLMNKAGRLALVKSVLSAIPIHQMLALAPPKKTLKQLEKIQRGFLWAGRAAAQGGHCHVNWRAVSRPLTLGGLGIRDLERTGLALRLRWLWLSRTDANRAWQGLDLQFSVRSSASSTPPPSWC
ncbi:Serine/threonine-protein kinase SMG1 [Hordeum vulgare]|nr:Serine/threonine-protein kinase SMG1 [Hordeum vulgare]